MKNDIQKYITRDEKMWYAIESLFIFGAVEMDIGIMFFLRTLNVFSWSGLFFGLCIVLINIVAYFSLKALLYRRIYILFDSENQQIIQVFKNQKKKQTKNFNYKDIIGYKVERGNKISAKNARRYDKWFPGQTDSGASWLMYGYIEIEGNRYVCIITSFSRRRVEKELKKIKKIIEQDKDKQIESLTKTLANLKQTNADLIFEIEQLRNQTSELHGDKVSQVETDIHISKTTELREIDSLLDQIADYELNKR